MKFNWIKVGDRRPSASNNIPFIPCIVYSCHPEYPRGGSIETCRWNVKNDCWLKSDVSSNCLLQKPYIITHFADDVETPFNSLN